MPSIGRNSRTAAIRPAAEPCEQRLDSDLEHAVRLGRRRQAETGRTI